jgi:hypothetical protein
MVEADEVEDEVVELEVEVEHDEMVHFIEHEVEVVEV